jgi:glucose-1-phosphate cytidylyltransferase
MQVVLLAGGLGSRLAEETVRIPKPMVEVGGQPIMLHVMDIYRHWGFRDFVVAGGYKAPLIKQFFKNLHLMNHDFTVDLSTGEIDVASRAPLDFKVSIVDTGELTMTGGRIRRLQKWLRDEPFMVTYSDGVGNINIKELVEFHRSHGKLATVTAVQPPARFGSLELDGDQVVEFAEKVQKHETWINGGFFVFEPGVFEYLSGDEEPLERAPLTKIARDGQLMAYKHHGFWHPMDTVRDRDHLNSLYDSGDAPWRQFDANPT